MANRYQYIDDLFLLKYPDGLEDEEYLNNAKRHRNTFKVIEMCQNFDLEQLVLKDSYHQNLCIDFMIKIITMSSTVSVFEKVAFKNYLADKRVWDEFLENLYLMLSDLNEQTFNNFVYTLMLKKHEKNANPAKWPVITFILQMFYPNDEVFVKPTTIKKVILFLESGIVYKSIPNFQTYAEIRELILDFKKHSALAKNQNNIVAQAILYIGLSI